MTPVPLQKIKDHQSLKRGEIINYVVIAADGTTHKYQMDLSLKDIEYHQRHEVMGQERFAPLKPPLSVYQRIARAETGGRKNPWIRTEALGSGSSAFGEAQITRGLIRDALKDPQRFKFDDEDVEYLKRLKAQGDLFLKYGGKDMKPGFERYDYGQSGDWKNDDLPLYRKSVGKIIDTLYTEHVSGGGQMTDFWRIWRFGSKGAKESANTDERYDREYNR